MSDVPHDDGMNLLADLIADIRRLGSVTRVAELRALGYSLDTIQSGVTSGAIVRPRKGWVAEPGLDPQLMFAATHGVVLSCVTLARREGLWVARPQERLHVAARHPNAHVFAPAHLHWSAPIVPRDPNSLLDPLPNMLSHVAYCLPREEALTIWESALNKRFTTLDQLAGLPFPARARSLLRECSPYSDSGLETLFKTRLRWLKVPVRAQIWLLEHRVDFLIGDRLIIQIDGKQHAGAQKTSDNQHDMELRSAGFHVMRFTYEQIMFDWPEVQAGIQDAIARGWHLRPSGLSTRPLTTPSQLIRPPGSSL